MLAGAGSSPASEGEAPATANFNGSAKKNRSQQQGLAAGCGSCSTVQAVRLWPEMGRGTWGGRGLARPRADYLPPGGFSGGLPRFSKPSTELGSSPIARMFSR